MKSTDVEAAAAAVRALFEDRIPKTWEQYEAQGNVSGAPGTGPSGSLINAYTAAWLVRDQINGPANPFTGLKPVAPCSMTDATQAVRVVMPELFTEYWENLPREVTHESTNNR